MPIITVKQPDPAALLLGDRSEWELKHHAASLPQPGTPAAGKRIFRLVDSAPYRAKSAPETKADYQNAKRLRRRIDMKKLLAGVAALSVLSASAAIAHGSEIPSQYRGLWCDLGNDKYRRCRKADSESYLDVGRKEISGLGEEVPACGVDKLVEIKNGWRIAVVDRHRPAA
jgi:hypothetical protein